MHVCLPLIVAMAVMISCRFGSLENKFSGLPDKSKEGASFKRSALFCVPGSTHRKANL